MHMLSMRPITVGRANLLPGEACCLYPVFRSFAAAVILDMQLVNRLTDVVFVVTTGRDVLGPSLLALLFASVDCLV